MSSKRWQREIESLRARYSASVDGLIPEASSVALLNYPNHSNVGDSAIWLGEIEYLHHRRCVIEYVCDLVSYDAEQLAASLPDDGIILLHGGGNLGDLWPAHQRFREQVLQDHPRHQVVILPQTINFQDPHALGRARRAFSSHERLTVIARDTASYEFAVGQFDSRVALAPDSAFWLSLEAPHESRSREEFVWLARTDHEAALTRGDSATTSNIATVDWLTPQLRGAPSMGQFRYHLLRDITRAMARLQPSARRWLSGVQQGQFDAVARWHLLRGCRLLDTGQVVITDRLHAHILSVLLGIPQVLMDDAHLKVRHFWETWTEDLHGVVWATNDEEAQIHAAALRNTP